MLDSRFNYIINKTLKEPKFLNRYKSEINSQFSDLLSKHKSENYYKPLAEYFLNKNNSPKRIRSALFLEIINGLEKSCSNHMQLACSLEYLHEFSLIHDDIQDQDEIRRGNLSLWKKFGTEKSILFGNITKIISDNITSDYNEINFKVKKEIIKCFNLVCINMIEGQYLDIKFENKKYIKLNEYLYMISRKTGALMSMAFYLPLILNESSKKEINLLKNIGDQFGLLLKISDDMLGIWGDPQSTGKSNLSDFEKNKKTFPLLLANEQFSKKDKKLFKELIYSKKDVKYSDLLKILDSYNIKNIIKNDCSKYITNSKRLIFKSNLNTQTKNNLNELFDYVIERVK